MFFIKQLTLQFNSANIGLSLGACGVLEQNLYTTLFISLVSTLDENVVVYVDIKHCIQIVCLDVSDE